ncbi:MAG: citrate lyase subunit alpha [Klebsiella michiganensis]|nr:citrate lyase subunit alpha [Klebsiella michiganensis]
MNQLTEALHNISGAQHQYEVFSGANTHTPYLADTRQKYQRKLFDTLDEVLSRCDLRDGMTVSFHHAFREGDQVINYVMARLAEKGLRGLTLASSSLMTCNAPLIEHIKHGVISKIYTSGMRGELADAISHGLMEEPVQIHSHGGRVNLIEKGEINIDVAFLAVSCCDEYGNASGSGGKSRYMPASIIQDQVDYIVKIDSVGDPAKISVGAARVTSNPRELMIARSAADVIEHSGYFRDGFSLQTGSGAASTACTRFLESRMRKHNIVASFALGGITGSIVDLHEKGLITKLLDTQSFDGAAGESLAKNPHHVEISTSVYANPAAKAACCDRVDIVILSALEIDTDFNVNVLTGSDGVMRGASGGHCDVAAAANLTIVVAPLIRSRIPTVVRHVTTRVTPGESIDVLVTDHGIAVNPARPEVKERLTAAGLPVVDIEALYQTSLVISGEPKPIEFTSRIVGVVRYRDGSVIDVVRQVKE